MVAIDEISWIFIFRDGAEGDYVGCVEGSVGDLLSQLCR